MPQLYEPTELPSHGGLDGSWSSSPLVLAHGSGLSPLLPSLWTVNITTYATIVLALVDDYPSWETKFSSFVIMYQLQGMLNGTIVQPVSLFWSLQAFSSQIQPIPAGFRLTNLFKNEFFLLSPRIHGVR